MHFFYLALWHHQDLYRIEHAATLAVVVVLAYDERDEQTSAKVDDNGRVPKASFGKLSERRGNGFATR